MNPTDTFLSKSLPTFSLYLALVIPFIVSTSTFFPYIVGKNVVFRIVAGLAAFGIAYGLLLKREEGIQHHVIVVAMVIFSAVMFLSAMSGVNPSKSLWSNLERMEGWVTLAALSIYLVALVQTFKDRKDWRMFLMVQLGISAIIAIIALLKASSGERVQATLGNPAYLGVYALFNVWIAGILANDRMEQLSFKFKHFFTRSWKDGFLLTYTAAAILNLAAMYFSQTRSVILGLAVGVVVMLGILSFSLPRTSSVKKVSIASILLIVILGGLFWSIRQSSVVQESKTLSRIANISLDDATTRSRVILWGIGTEAWKERPLLGWGQDNFIYAFGEHFDPRMWDQEEWFDRAHNVFFDWLTQGGLLGLLSYLAIFGSVLWSLYRTKKISLIEKSLLTGLVVSHLVNNFFVFDNITSYLLFVIVLGYVAFRSEIFAFKTPSKITPLFAIANVVIAFVVVWSALNAWNGGQGIIDAITNLRKGEVVEASRIFDGLSDTYGVAQQETVEQFALNIQGLLNPELASVPMADKQDYLQNAVAQYERQVALDPRNGRLRIIGGSMYSNLNELEKGGEQFKTAYELMPAKQSAVNAYAQVLLLQKKGKDALDILTPVYVETPQHPEVAKRYVAALIATGNIEEAQKIMKLPGNEGIVGQEIVITQLIEAKRFDIVINFFKQQVAAEPTNPQLLVSLASAYEKSGNKAMALSLLFQAKNKFPDIADQIDVVITQVKSKK